MVDEVRESPKYQKTMNVQYFVTIHRIVVEIFQISLEETIRQTIRVNAQQKVKLWVGFEIPGGSEIQGR